MAYTIFIQRKWQTSKSTISEFTIPGTSIKGYFLECPGPDTTTSGLKKRIPEGCYSLMWHKSVNFSGYNPVPLLFNAGVSASRYILIHPGNYPHDTVGCLLPGMNRIANEVRSSVMMYKKIKDFITEKGIHNVNVIITSCYVDGKK